MPSAMTPYVAAGELLSGMWVPRTISVSVTPGTGPLSDVDPPASSFALEQAAAKRPAVIRNATSPENIQRFIVVYLSLWGADAGSSYGKPLRGALLCGQSTPALSTGQLVDVLAPNPTIRAHSTYRPVRRPLDLIYN